MKKLTLSLTALFLIVLTACGGGRTDAEVAAARNSAVGSMFLQIDGIG